MMVLMYDCTAPEKGNRAAMIQDAALPRRIQIFGIVVELEAPINKTNLRFVLALVARIRF